MDLSPNQIKQMIELLQNMLPNSETEDEEETQISAIKTKKTKLSKSKKGYKNKFLSMDEKNMHKEDLEIDKKLSVNPPVLRNRSGSTIKARCRVCGRTETVSIGTVGDVERFKCNRCAISAG